MEQEKQFRNILSIEPFLVGRENRTKYRIIDGQRNPLISFDNLSDAGICLRYLTSKQMPMDEAKQALDLLKEFDNCRNLHKFADDKGGKSDE